MIFKNAISWFEIPATDIHRAQKFYESIFDFQMIPMDLQQIQMRMFPTTDMMNGIGGAVCTSGGFHIPSEDKGPLIYLNANPDVQIVLDKIEGAGGRILGTKADFSGIRLYGGVYRYRRKPGSAAFRSASVRR
jgi:predicted enzyme related to lactoylglutathione lyase